MIALLLILVLFVGDLGINNFMALSVYADENTVINDSAAVQENEPAEEAEDENAVAQAEAADAIESESNEDSDAEAGNTAEEKTADESGAGAGVMNAPSEEAGDKTANVPETEEEPDDQEGEIDYSFPTVEVKLADILAAMGIELSDSSYKISVSSRAVKLSAAKFEPEELAEVTLSATRAFKSAALSLISADETESYSVTISCVEAFIANSEQDDAAADAEKATEETATEETVTEENVIEDTATEENAAQEKDGFMSADSSEADEQSESTEASTEKTLTPEIEGEAQITLTGSMPEDATAEVTTVEVEISGADVMAAYDISIFTEESEGGEKWQPAEGESVLVELYDPSFVGTVDIYHMEDESSEPVLVASAEALDGWIRFMAAGFSVYAFGRKLEKTVSAGDGKSYLVTVTYGQECGIPEGAELVVSELNAEEEEYDAYVAQSAAMAKLDGSALKLVRVFDIAILDPATGEHCQPQSEVHVEIRLLEDAISESEQFSLIHFGEQTEEMAAEAAGSTVSFETSGFSVYVIVQGPTDAYEPSGTYLASSVDKIAALGDEGFYLSHNGYYLTGGIVSNVTNDRSGLDATADQNDSIPGSAAKFYFSRISGNQFTIYLMQESNRRYIQMTRVAGNSARAGLILTDDESSATAFTLEKNGSSNTFYFYATVEGATFYWNRNTKNPGNGAFVGYNNKADGNTAKIALQYVREPQDDPYGLDGKSYGLMNYTTGTSAYALMSSALSKNGTERLAAKQMLVRGDPLDQSRMLYVAKNAELPMWSFENIRDDRYYVKTGGQYLRIDGSNITLSGSEDACCEMRVIAGDGKIQILGVAANRALSFSGKEGDGFTLAAQANNNNQWFNFVEHSVYGDDDFIEYYAYKVSVSDSVNVANGKQIVIYTRVWNEAEKKYEFYAVDHNGYLVPCYESGDTLVWIGSRNNTLLWEFTEYYRPGTSTPNGYYELQNAYSGKYVAPQISGGQVFSDSTIGINLSGRQGGDYFSPILAWDDSHYDYAGWKSENGKVVSCPMAQAETFYFAVIDLASATLTPVETVDHNALGLTMKMVNFDGNSWQNSVLGSSAGGMGTDLQQGLLQTQIAGGDSGYPLTQTGASLGELYTGATTVNHLFIQSIYDGSGYYQFDSSENFAHLNGNSFEVYQELGAVKNSGNTHSHGQFMPYNTLDTSHAHPDNPRNLTDIYGRELPDSYPRKYETLYGYTEADDSYFGMEIEGHFMQPANGHDAWGHDIIFEFVGDDDFWLYVDGELVIDLGGIHSAVGASVNYSTGKVVIKNTATTLYELFESNYKTRNPSATEAEVEAHLNAIFTAKTVTVNGKSETHYVFKDYSAHTVRIFYMERGAGASNLRMRFNLASVTPGQVLLSKEISGTDKQDFASVKFPFQIFYDEGSGGGYEQLTQGVISATGRWQVVYQNSSTHVEYADSVTIEGVTYEKVFFLKPGQTAAIKIPDNTISYYIRECGVDTRIYDDVLVNGEAPTENTPSGAVNTRCYETDAASVLDRARVNFVNHVSPSALRTLTITKRLFDAEGNELTAEQDSTAFTVRMYLGDEGNYYSLGEYYVKAPDRSYCYFDADAGTFASTGVADFDSLSADQILRVTFRTSPSGAISKLPTGYNIEIRGLLVGTRFKVVEEDYDIPLGYGKRVWTETESGIITTYVGYKRVTGTYIVSAGDPVNVGEIRDNSNAVIEIHNQAGWGIRANKVWSDTDFMQTHDYTYFAVYVDDVLLDGSVRRIDAYNYTTYFFPALESGRSFSDYQVCEVKLTNPVLNADGSVTYDAIEKIAANDILTLGGTNKDGGREDSLDYVVSYRQGSGSKTRIDTVTNTRIGGLRIVKTDMNGNGVAGAQFELKRGSDMIGSYRSDADGLVTTAYLEDGTYTLTETAAPGQYQVLTSEFTIVASSGSFTVTGGGAGGNYSYNASTKTLTIQNKPVTLTVKIVDSADNTPISGAHFALYKQFKAPDGQLHKDYYPISGYEDLVSDASGVITGIDQTLAPGSYYLTQTRTADGYVMPTPVKDVLLTISKTSVVSIDTGAAYTGTLSQSGTDSVEYTVILTNAKDDSSPAPTGFVSHSEPYVWMLSLGVLLLGLVIIRIVHRKKLSLIA